MRIVRLRDCGEFISGDGAVLRELLNPLKQPGDFRYSLAHARVGPGVRTRPHRLKTSEIYYVIEGEGRMFIDDENHGVSPGDAVVIPPRAVQSIENVGKTDLVFLCIVDPAWRPEDEEILE